jgi:type IV conjugative transfer system coupling protein TraD
MSRPSKGNLSAWLRGGQTIGHTVDMIREVLARIVIILILWGVVCVICVNVRASEEEQAHGTVAFMANLLEWVGPPAPQHISVPTPGYGPRRYPVSEVESLPWVAPYAQAYREHFLLGLGLWLCGVLLLGLISAWWYTSAGKSKLRTRHIRGQTIVSARVLAAEVAAFNKEEAIRLNRPQHIPARLVDVQYPFDTEQEHTLVVGGPGSGKTVALDKLLLSIRERGDRGIVYDPELQFIPKHYDPDTDIILNPFDDRSPAWSPFFDAKDHVEWDRLAHGLFKDPKSGDPYWTNVARSVFSWACFTLQERDPNVTLEQALRFLFGPTTTLANLLIGTPAAQHLAGGQSPRVSSIQSVMVEGVTPLIYLLGKGEPFSIRAWVNQQRRTPGILFLSAPETHADTLRPLLGFWSEIAVSALLSRNAEKVPPHPTWIMLDEFPSLGRIDKLADGPQRLRKYGGAMVFGMQQVSQIQDIYGRERARTIVGQCANKLILRANDNETAQMMSEILGERVMHRVTENTSYGANSIRDGVGISPREEKEPVYLPTDIMNFPKLQGVIRLSNARAGRAFPIAPISFTWADLPVIADPFIKRQGPDPVRAFLGITPRPPAGGPPPQTAPTPASGGASLQLVVDNDNDGTADTAQQELPLDITEQPTQQGLEAAAREAAEQERVRLEQQQRQLNEGNDTPDRPDDPAGELAVDANKPGLDINDYLEIH